MKALVTGAAGFIGSHLCEALLARGDEVAAIDCFTPFYDRGAKESNIAGIADAPRFRLVDADLAAAPLRSLLLDVDVVFHLAGQPGVRPSWGAEFDAYVRHNVVATQRLLEATLDSPPSKLVYASSSSVYGDAESFPTPESVLPRPVSPYGVTKLAGEHLCALYQQSFGVPTVSLRLFSVYGPRQRPDMAFARLVKAAVNGDVFELYGDGQQTRDFTFVADVVRAMLAAAEANWCGVANVGGGSRTSMNEVISLVESIGGPLRIARSDAVHGDARHTSADITVARTAFGFTPSTTLAEGLEAMIAWESDRTAVGR